MGTRKQREKQEDLWIAHTELVAAPGHPFYQIAVSIYVLVAIVRKRLGLEASLYQILQILSVTLFEKTAHFTGTSGVRLR